MNAEEAVAQNKMGTQPINRLLLGMALPMMFAMFVQSLYNIVDRIFVAYLSEDAFAAVSLTFPAQMLMLQVAVGISVGINALLSKSLGERNFAQVNKSALNGLFLAGLAAVVFMVFGGWGTEIYFRSQNVSGALLQYGQEYLSLVSLFSATLVGQVILERLLMSTGKAVYQMISQIVGAVVNIILDPIMIFGLLGCPALGVKGAAVATVLGEGSACALALYFNLTKNKEINFSFRGFRPDLTVIRKICAVGVPAILMGTLLSLAIYGQNRILMGLAEASTAVAVLGAYFGLESFVFMPVFGLNNALIPIVAYNFGARNKQRLLRALKLGCLYTLGIMLLGTLLFQLFAEKLLLIFNATEQMLRIGAPALRIISISYVFFALGIVLNSVFQALGHGLESFLATAFRLGVLLLSVWLLSLTGVLAAVWWSSPLSGAAALLFSLFLFRRIYERQIETIPAAAVETCPAGN
ncbi:MAG: MATE family efflux transporter [Candidatus Margulisbacteria bacterium]|jgi:putative MATE family efflux protein|nr:MATE family efflux transporter [Candidatus Margulisiibacteriota bacterium]